MKNILTSRCMQIILLMLTAVMICGLQIGIEALSDHYSMNLDLSHVGYSKLSEQTIEFLNTIKNKVHLYLFYRDGTTSEDRIHIENFLGQYVTKCKYVQLHIIDPITNPGVIKRLLKDISSVVEGTIVVTDELETRVRKINPDEIYAFKQNETTAEYKKYAFYGETRVTNAMQYVLLKDAPKVSFLAGHEELDIKLCKRLVEQLELLNYQVSEISTVQNTLEDTDILIVLAPCIDLTDMEYNEILSWMENGGKMFFATDPSVDMNNLVNFSKILSYYGLFIEKGYVIEDEIEISRYISSPQYLIPRLNNQSELMKDLLSVRIILPQCGAIGYAQNSYGTLYTTLLSSSDKAYLKNVDGAGDLFSHDENDTYGPFSVAVSMENSRQNIRIIAIANIYTVADTNYLNSSNNLKFSVSSINWLLNRNNVLQIPVRIISEETIAIPDMKTYWIISAFVIGFLPLVMLIMGLVICERRKHM